MATDKRLRFYPINCRIFAALQLTSLYWKMLERWCKITSQMRISD
jgi:hypothetical protein